MESNVNYDGIVNEIKYKYNVNMPLQKLYQSHSGSVGAFTPFLKYSYDAAHGNRLYRSELYGYDN